MREIGKRIFDLSTAVFVLLLGVFMGFAPCMQAFGQGKRLFTPEDQLNLKRLTDPQISPSGDWVAFTVSQFEANRKSNTDVWMVSKDGQMLKQLTKNPGPDSTPRWSPKGDRLAFLSRLPEDEFSQIYFFWLADEKIEKATVAHSTIRDFKWAPDGQTIALLMRDQLTRTDIGRRDLGDDAYVVDKDIKHNRLWILDLATGDARLLTRQDMTVTEFNFSPDSTQIAVLASASPKAEHYEYHSHLGLVDVQSGEEKILTSSVNVLTAPVFSWDGEQIAYIGPIDTFLERGILKVISASGGEPIELLRDFKGNVWGVQWHPAWKAVLGAVAQGVNHRLLSVDLKQQTNLLMQMDYSLIPYWQDCWSISADGQYVAYLNEKLDCPPEVWISTLKGTGQKQLTHFNDYLNSVRLGQVEEIHWTNPADGADVNGILVKPVNFTPGKAFPLVVWFHGGPAYNWSLGVQMNSWAQLFAARGYMVFLPNFRGSSGLGMDWMRRNEGNWGQGPMSDVMYGVSHLVKKGWADKNRLFMGGSSYGGYLTAWIITQTDRFKAAYVSAGITDLVTEYQLTDEPSLLVGYFKSTPYDNTDVYWQNSPIVFAENVRTSVLIVHGERDVRVPISQAYQFYSALKHYGAPVEMVVYPREGHGIREYAHQLDLMNRVLDWFAQHTPQ